MTHHIGGKVFGRLTVISRNGSSPDRQATWLCQCICGNEKITRSSLLRKGITRSCGCLSIEVSTERCLSSLTKHGESYNTEYRSWCGMKSRCLDKNNKKYRIYGAIGVRVCDRWLTSFSNFLEDMGRKPSPIHSLDRYPDPYGNYEPSNCRWATPLQQRHNRRGSKNESADQ